MRKITVKAYAKINLGIDVLGKRPDSYHEVRMIMRGITLYDEVELSRQDSGIIFTCDQGELCAERENLAYIAAEKVCETVGLNLGIRIDLKKRIPIAAGLAGGSSDAAAVILGMDSLYGLKLRLEDLQGIAAKIGSDVPFCLYPLTALAEGRGERITVLPSGPELHMVLCKPTFGISTKAVYDHLSKIKIHSRPKIEKLISVIIAGDRAKLIDNAVNVLEYASFDLHPELYALRKTLLEMGAEKVLMSGSGPTMIGFMDKGDKAEKLALKLRSEGMDAFYARTTRTSDLDGSIRVIDR